MDEGVGTVNYMAPECESGSDDVIGIGADLYSAGKILWSAITGLKAFSRENPVSTRSRCLKCSRTTRTLGTYITSLRRLFAVTGVTGGGPLPRPRLWPDECASSSNAVIHPLRKLDPDVQSAGSESCQIFQAAMVSLAIPILKGLSQGNVHIAVFVSHSIHLGARRFSTDVRNLSENGPTRAWSRPRKLGGSSLTLGREEFTFRINCCTM